jgi:bidirectional [NiFe] hydrogenase diaphorase subunit
MGKQIDLHEVTNQELAARSQMTCRVKVCSSTACLSAGSAAARTSIERSVAEHHLTHEVQVVPTGCMGLCSRGPLVRVEPRGAEPTMYEQVDAELGTRIGEDHVARRRPLAEGVLDESIPFFTRQERVVLGNAGLIDPSRLEDYVAEGGYSALAHALRTMSPEQVVDEISASGLRGRGGAGYPSGSKWDLLRQASGDEKYVVANGDEGDPGAYMDRTVMEDDPHKVLEGIILAAYATGAHEAFIYVRAEYPTAVERLDRAIRVAQRHGLLGRNIMDSGFGLSVSVRIGAGAFVCGEETALLSSIEGLRGTPRLRPPYPTERGLWGKPTMINNVETLANVPGIIGRGAEWFSSMGTETSKGTKVFALAGNLVNTGLIEVPMGITLREIVFDIGGGIPEGREFKAAQTGGPSGGCIPAAHLDTPVDYEHLRALGSIMGSGGLIVMDDDVRMPDVAKYFMEFCRDESCGKCVPCRVGTVELHQLLDKVCRGDARPADLTNLESLCRTVRDTSLCGLGQSAPNPIFSTLHHFREEYESLLVDGGAQDA